ncbi:MULTISPECIES: menaquinone-dependent protoporphyrinogen IX dehydrogenase [Marinomonas]|uniref:Protoporphyrinogen IX dehydrogenase [quinone] n=1 Tax=Marinomonas arctica TaxID=383750 RepID=A0A7H1J2W2_9GAMM|nr:MULTISPECIES: menaquinone-dependent protoporphyrinogen IX dehydrogenase [Marinomonas]MCS7486540.1 protoporphyrinogen oxidase [Marinomonas sp. BSi20414]QNT04828.1 menaquinone-dependent protoporphyrinogen IX dehydrogenase [Marinomonas arctica]GGN31128.1 protoporphyrinogen oxidase [Marinomonas arctica]
MSNTLLIYATTDGHTKKISLKMQAFIESQGDAVTLVAVEDATAQTLASHDKIVIGASIRYGKHQKIVADFITQHKDQLESKSSAFYTVNLVARKPEKCQPDTNPYIIKFLDQLHWQPALKGVFAGKLNYPKYGFIDRNMIRFIMWMTKGPTDPKTNMEFTDWQSVDRFAQAVCDMP